MQKELTISLSDETYQGLMNLVGEKNASQFIEAVLRPHVSQTQEEYEVKLPLNNGERKIYIRSPRLINPSDAKIFKVQLVEENLNA
jgi:hypothetical protein